VENGGSDLNRANRDESNCSNPFCRNPASPEANAAYWHAFMARIHVIPGTILNHRIFEIISDGCREGSQNKLKNKT